MVHHSSINLPFFLDSLNCTVFRHLNIRFCFVGSNTSSMLHNAISNIILKITKNYLFVKLFYVSSVRLSHVYSFFIILLWINLFALVEPVDNQLYISSDDLTLARVHNLHNQSVLDTSLPSTSRDNQTYQMQVLNDGGGKVYLYKTAKLFLLRFEYSTLKGNVIT